MSRQLPRVPELHPMADADHVALALLPWANDVLAWLYAFQVPHAVKEKGFPLEMEHYVQITDDMSRIRQMQSNFLENKAGEPCQSSPAATA